ncbi:MAG: hypothetical protein ACE5HL_07110 [Terriglobia bacterium]
MKRTLPVVAAILLLTAAVVSAQAVDRWLHVYVKETGGKAETVRVNLPLSVAEKVLPAIQTDKLRGGKVKLRDVNVKGVDLRVLLEAVRGLGDGEFLTVESDKETVRAAKQGGYLIIKVQEGREGGDKVDVKIPFTVVEALLSGEEDELDILAAVRALNEHGDDVLVTVTDKSSTVRVWVDSRNTME